jgi:hypothetical protein
MRAISSALYIVAGAPCTVGVGQLSDGTGGAGLVVHDRANEDQLGVGRPITAFDSDAGAFLDPRQVGRRDRELHPHRREIGDGEQGGAGFDRAAQLGRACDHSSGQLRAHLIDPQQPGRALRQGIDLRLVDADRGQFLACKLHPDGRSLGRRARLDIVLLGRDPLVPQALLAPQRRLRELLVAQGGEVFTLGLRDFAAFDHRQHVSARDRLTELLADFPQGPGHIGRHM